MAASDRADGVGDRYAETILHRSRRRIEIFAGAGDDWRFAESLKSVGEDTAQEYGGRALFELIQNGYDALGLGGRGRIRIVLDSQAGEHGTLYVANEGQPFCEGNFKAITEFGLSNKGAGEGVGNKGLGFRSVLQLTDWPEVYSKSEKASAAFDGYCFRFATPADVAALVNDPALVREVVQKVSPLALPVPAQANDDRVRKLGADGFSTVVRLPLRNDRARQAAIKQLENLAEHEVPVLLFLKRLTSVEIECDSDDPWRHVLERTEDTFEPLANVPWVTTADLGDHGTFLLAVRAVRAEDLTTSIEASIAAREIDEKWREWDGEAVVSIALGLDGAPDPGRLYTFLPMSATAASPFAGHAHAPFFTKLARLDISESVALNDYLLDQVAALARDLLRELTRLDPAQLPAGITIDLACWTPPDRIRSAFDAAGASLLHEPFIPVAGKSRWGTPEECYQWPHTGTTVVTAKALTELGVKVVDERLGAAHRRRLDSLHEALVGRSMAPEPSEAANWVERLADHLRRHDASFGRWADYYDDLAAIFRDSPSALSGCAIILDQDGELAKALGGTDPNGSRQTIFFAPEESVADDAASRLPRDLRALRRRISFTHPGIPWTTPGTPPRRRPGRVFLEPLLVREYRTDRVFEAINELLHDKQSAAFRRDALIFAYRQFSTLNDAQRGQLRRYHFHVPIHEGSWQRATEALFHPDWSTDGGRRMERFLSAGGDSIPEFARLRDRWIAPPANWPVAIDDQPGWSSFLAALGVRDGLLLFVVDAKTAEREGNSMRPEALAGIFKFDERLRRDWPALVRSAWTDFAHPWTKYAFEHPLAYIPGAAAVEGLSARAKREFAELVLQSLPDWADRSFAVRVRRPNRPYAQQDLHTWPTPLSAQLRHLEWLPLVDEAAPDGLRFVRPDHVWFATDGELPPFMPSLPSSAKRLLANEVALRRLTQSGLRGWEDSRNGPELVRDLGELLDSGAIPAHLTVHYKKHYQRGWAETARLRRWPWAGGNEPLFAVTEASALSVVERAEEVRLFVPDEDNHFKEALLDLAGYPVLVTATEDGAAVRELLAANGVQARGFTDTDILIEADGKVVVPSSDCPLLVADADWLPTLFGLVLELKSGEFRRRTERAVRELMERVRALRIARARVVSVVIEGELAETPTTTRSLPVDDDRYPTIVVWSAEPGWDEWRAITPSLCQLLKQPALQAPLELALVKLQGQLGERHPVEVLDEHFAGALDTPAHKVRELRRSLTGELIETVYRLRPVLVCALGTARLDEINRHLQRVSSPDALQTSLELWADDLPLSIGETLTVAQQSASLGEVRDRVGQRFEPFNDALAALGPPYRPITHPDLHAQVFASFVSAHEQEIVGALRAHYTALAQRGQDLSGYVAGRRLEGLEPDPSWLHRFEVPPADEIARVVAAWLSAHGVHDHWQTPVTTAELGDLRRTNFACVEDVVEKARLRVAAWCRLNRQPVPPGWASVPAMTVRGAIEGDGIADLITLEEDWIVERSARVAGWPAGMPKTLSLEALGLAPQDLAELDGEPARGGRPQKRAQTIDVAGRPFEVGVDHLAEIARAAYDTIDEQFLDQKGTVRLGDAPDAGRGAAGRRGGSIVVARTPGMTEEQRTAVGLVGEVVARAWLERRYEGVRWRSGYAVLVANDPDGSDDWGYDFEAPYRNSSLYFEVKSTVDAPSDLAEIELGWTEVDAAQRCAGGDRYRLLLVTSVLEPIARQIFVLPSPFSKKGAGRFRVIGRGLRYRFQLS